MRRRRLAPRRASAAIARASRVGLAAGASLRGARRRRLRRLRLRLRRLRLRLLRLLRLLLRLRLGRRRLQLMRVQLQLMRLHTTQVRSSSVLITLWWSVRARTSSQL